MGYNKCKNLQRVMNAYSVIGLSMLIKDFILLINMDTRITDNFCILLNFIMYLSLGYIFFYMDKVEDIRLMFLSYIWSGVTCIIAVIVAYIYGIYSQQYGSIVLGKIALYQFCESLMIIGVAGTFGLLDG